MRVLMQQETYSICNNESSDRYQHIVCSPPPFCMFTHSLIIFPNPHLPTQPRYCHSSQAVGRMWWLQLDAMAISYLSLCKLILVMSCCIILLTSAKSIPDIQTLLTNVSMFLRLIYIVYFFLLLLLLTLALVKQRTLIQTRNDVTSLILAL